MGRIRTFKTKILLLVFTVLLAAAVPLVILARAEIASSLYRREQEFSRSVLSLVLQTIESQYQDLIYDNRTVLDMRKEAMKDLAGVVISTIEGFFNRYHQGSLSENEAKRQALEQIKTFRYRNDDYFFVYDTQFTAIAHADPLFMGKRLGDYRDAKGMLVIRELMKASREPGGGFILYWWKRLKDSQPVRKIGYAVFYPRWQWMIGTGLYTDDLDSEYQRKLSAIVAQLKNTFSKITAEQGVSLFLFDGNKHFIIPPMDSEDERPRLENFVQISMSPGKPFRYLSDPRVGPSPSQVWKEADVAYFKPLDWYVVASFDEANLKRPGEILVRKAVMFTLIALIGGLVLAYVIGMKISRPLSELAGFAKDLAARDFRPETGSSVERLSGRADEVGRLAAAFSFMQKMLQDYLGRLQQTTAAKERIESELRIGRQIQMGLLPRKLTGSGPRNFAIHGFLEPAREVGGDFYDYFYADDRHLCLVIGDVCDKGVPASLFMAVSKTLVRLTTTLIRTLTAHGSPPDEVLRRVNSELARENEHCMFVTIFLGIVQLESGKLEYSNGGHNPPLLISPDGSLRALDDLRAVPVGVKTEARYGKSVLQLLPGDTLFMYTDGITEAENAQGKLFSENRLIACLAGTRGESLEECARRVVQEVTNFRESSPQSDDMTLLVFKYLGEPSGV